MHAINLDKIGLYQYDLTCLFLCGKTSGHSCVIKSLHQEEI
jgi:hypothetical protein